jgi:hypothetical protein
MELFRTLILPFVLYGCEVLSLTLSEEGVSEQGAEENIWTYEGGWRRLHNEELHNLYTSPGIIRVIKSRRVRWAGHIVRTGDMRNVYNILVGKPPLV